MTRRSYPRENVLRRALSITARRRTQAFEETVARGEATWSADNETLFRLLTEAEQARPILGESSACQLLCCCVCGATNRFHLSDAAGSFNLFTHPRSAAMRLSSPEE